MPKYRKFHSNFIRSKIHKSLADGSTSIIERDWGTLGERHRLERGKRPIWSDTNFIFTDNSRPGLKTRHTAGPWGDKLTKDDVKDAKPDNNQVKVNMLSNDLRDFAYYGSCVELVQSTILSIIRWFPGRITVTNTEQYKPTESGGYEVMKGMYVVSNPFSIDLHHDDVVVGDYDNPLHYMAESWSEYQVGTDEDSLTDIESFSVTKNKDIKCRTEDDYSSPIYTINIGGLTTIFGYYIDRTIKYLSADKGLIIQPKPEVIEQYFDDLDGFEKQLLTRDTKPLYRNSFLTPVITAEYSPYYVFRNYTWPSSGYCIDADSPRFSEFVSKLLKLAEDMDKLWCDNLWGRMTHEAIKNYDWTYTREYEDGEEEYNVIGGQNIEKLMRIFGRGFDDLKRWIDGIKYTKKTTYDGFNNLSSAEMSDKLDMIGWDVFSTIPSGLTVKDDDGTTDVPFDASVVKITDDYLKEKGLHWFGWRSGDDGDKLLKHVSVNPEKLDMTNQDIEFMRELRLSSRRIMHTKGTRQAIDMVMGMFGFGEGDYTVKETMYTVKDVASHKSDDVLDTIIGINDRKNGTKYYDDELTGLPLKTVRLWDGSKYETYVVPFLEEDIYYDGDVFFEGNGGWCKSGSLESIKSETAYPTRDYDETQTYLKVVQNVSALMDLSSRSVEEDAIYYCASIADVTDYDNSITEDEAKKMSHFFHCNNNWSPEEYSSWDNIPIEDDGTEIWKRADYLNRIVNYTGGNNPHVGYGYYDLGNTYRDYMVQPFKYAIEQEDINSEDVEKADGIKYDVEHNEDITVELGEDGVDADGRTKDDKIRRLHEVVGEERESEVDKYYLNSKVVEFALTGNIGKSNLFKSYFQSVILPYLTQVIPSTTILILNNCDPDGK